MEKPRVNRHLSSVAFRRELTYEGGVYAAITYRSDMDYISIWG